MQRFLVILVALFLAACSTDPVSTLQMGLAVENPKFEDSDPVEWKGRNPWLYPVHGIDVARYQGAINWRTVKRNNVSFAFIKATEGKDHLDDNFQENWRGAAAAGMPRGAYHFYYFCSTAFSQARWFIRNVPKEANSLPPVLDMEWNAHSRTCKNRPSKTLVRLEMKRFLSIVQRHYGKRPIIYTTVDFYKDNDLASFKGYEFWLRSVAGHPSEVYPGQRWSFWQYTGTGRIPGIKGDTDINVFAGTPESWRKWLENHTK